MIPAPLQRAYDNKVTLNQSELSRVLDMDQGTLLSHIKAGNIRYTVKGTGKVRERREFTLAQVLEFLQRRSQTCQSTSAKARRTSTSTSSSQGVSFLALRAARSSEKRKRSNGNAA